MQNVCEDITSVCCKYIDNGKTFANNAKSNGRYQLRKSALNSKHCSEIIAVEFRGCRELLLS